MHPLCSDLDNPIQLPTYSHHIQVQCLQVRSGNAGIVYSCSLLHPPESLIVFTGLRIRFTIGDMDDDFVYRPSIL